MNYWRGFGLLFGLIALLIWFTYYQKGKENEKALINRDPAFEARRDFNEGKIAFLQVFQLTNKKEGPLGVWVIPGGNKIGEDILNQYLKRRRLEMSFNFRLDEDQESIAARAHEFALSYNLEIFDQIQRIRRHDTEQEQ